MQHTYNRTVLLLKLVQRIQNWN